jgi:molecular chaperone DnaK
MEKLATESQAMGSAIYAQTGATQSQDAGAGAAGGEQAGATSGAEDVVDAEIVDEDGKK